MGIRLSNRDKQIMEFIKEFRVASTSQLVELFNINRSTLSRRMNQLIPNIKELKKMNYNPTYNFYDYKFKPQLKNENVYYWNRKSKSTEHDLLINNFYIHLKKESEIQGFTIKEFYREYRICLDDFTVIADAYILIDYKGIESEYIFELENNKDFNYKKYYRLEQQGIILPPLLICTNRRIVNYCKNLEIIKVHLDNSDIQKFINDFKNMTREYKYKVNF